MKVCALLWISSGLPLFTPSLLPTKIQRMSIKSLSVAKWLSVNADEHGYGDNDGSGKNPWKEHFLWSQIDPSLNSDLSFTNRPTLEELLHLPGLFFF